MGFLFGVVIGVVAGLLLAPQRGDVTREELRQASEELRRRAEDLAERARKISEDAQTRTQKLLEDVRARDGGTSEGATG